MRTAVKRAKTAISTDAENKDELLDLLSNKLTKHLKVI